jgi:hypothetical protein
LLNTPFRRKSENATLAKNRQIVFYLNEVISIHSGELPMRIASSIFVGSITVLAALASPAFANDSSLNSHANANAQAVEEAPASSPCRAYQKGPDGNWVEMACHEGAGSDPLPTPPRKSANRHQPDQSAR